MDINYTTSELKMCIAFARIAAPQDFREMYDHMCDVAKPYGQYHPEAVSYTHLTLPTNREV